MGKMFTIGSILLFHVLGANAHHAIEIDYDQNSLLTLEGELISADWINPHVIIGVESQNTNGSTVTWYVQAGTPNTLLRRGINRNSLRARETILTIGDSSVTSSPGISVVVSGYQIIGLPCNQTCNIFGRDITFPDGRTVSINGD